MVTHAHRSLELPSPARAAGPFALIGLAALGLEADSRLWLVGLLAAALFVLAGGVRAVAAERELARLRRAADRVILQELAASDVSALVAWRRHELTQPTERLRVQRELDRLVRSLAPARLPSSSPVNRPAARANADLLGVLGLRLRDERPVGARGLLLARSLLRDSSSPLYNGGSDERLRRILMRTIAALET